MSSRGSTLTPLDDYLTGLSRALPGPRRRKADLLAEARDHLVDATEAFEADGLDRDNAEREAVADFGALDEVVPGYRAELAVSQSRRTAMLLFLVLIIQPIVWQEGAWSWNQDPVGESALNDFLQTLVRTIGMVAIAGAVLAVIATGIGMRYPIIRDYLSRTTALFAIAASTIVSAIGVGMAATSTHPVAPLDYAVVGGFVVLPLFVVGLQAGRCLRLARA
ncbi:MULTISPECIES: permease prefix domain 1-containing protein [unclassified Kribbella]|uniref:permease prefix domain 1-containing protein n=1 Tax=unclassified Kribbella TaxID=2644121 RepID=UPI003019088F